MGDPIITETFVEYAIGMTFLFVRMFARLKFGGLQGLQIDDAFAGAAMVCIRTLSMKYLDSKLSIPIDRPFGLHNQLSFISSV